MRRDDRDLIAGTLDVLVLRALASAPLHGYAIARVIQQASDDVLKVEEGALYPALHRLEVRGELKSRWGASENNRRAKYYQITALGRRSLVAESEQWERLAAAVSRVLRTA
ncbi:MAG TPA: PadR family transcriptional regulator [Vicinamibacterales bacterium]|nr:PadR family transcriptional regulator [Vicinamibacterales bacterium]